MRLSENRERVKRFFEISSSPTAANGYEWLRMVTNGYAKNAGTAPEEAAPRPAVETNGRDVRTSCEKNATQSTRGFSESGRFFDVLADKAGIDCPVSGGKLLA